MAAAASTPGIVFVCGSNPFVETASQLAMQAGYAPGQIRTERFGPTGSMA